MYRSIVVERSRFQDRYVRRVVDIELDELFPQLPAIVLDGPKGVGKTATALQRATTTWRLDDPIQREALDADPSLLAFGDRPVLVDEWQRLPQTWDAVRRAVDDDPSGGRFLLTGSAPVRETHSGAGRITTFRMRPLTLSERGATDPTVSFRDLLDGRSASTLRATSPITLKATSHVCTSHAGATGRPSAKSGNSSALSSANTSATAKPCNMRICAGREALRKLNI